MLSFVEHIKGSVVWETAYADNQPWKLVGIFTLEDIAKRTADQHGRLNDRSKIQDHIALRIGDVDKKLYVLDATIPQGCLLNTNFIRAHVDRRAAALAKLTPADRDVASLKDEEV